MHPVLALEWSRVVTLVSGLASLAEVPALVSVKVDPHMPDGCDQGGATVKQASSHGRGYPPR